MMDGIAENGLQFVQARLGQRWRAQGLCGALFVESAARGLGACFKGHAVGHAVKPASQRAAFMDRCRLACENEEGGLKGVLRILLVP